MNVGAVSEADLRRIPISDVVKSDLANETTGYVDSPVTTSSLTSQSRKAALDICRTAPTYQSTSGQWQHAIQMVCPLRMALVVLRQDPDSRQAIWLEDIIQQIGKSRQGWAIGTYITRGYGYY